MTVDPATPAKSPGRILDPMDRISEVLFGLIMALTFTCTLGVATADHIEVRTMLLARWAAAWPGASSTAASTCWLASTSAAAQY